MRVECKNPDCQEVFTKKRNERYCSEECINEVANKIRKEKVVISKEIGNCTYCFKPKDNLRYALCLNCRLKKRMRYQSAKRD